MIKPYLCIPDKDNSFYDLDVDYNLSPELVFVFGSNLMGRHGAGAARTALKDYGAIYFKGEGIAGHSYAIPTKDKRIQTLPLEEIKKYVRRFIEFTHTQDLYFYVTPIGTGLAGYQHKDIAPMFKGARNCWFPRIWRHHLLTKEEIILHTKRNLNVKR